MDPTSLKTNNEILEDTATAVALYTNNLKQLVQAAFDIIPDISTLKDVSEHYIYLIEGLTEERIEEINYGTETLPT